MYMPVLCVLVLCHVSYVACFVCLGSCETCITKHATLPVLCVLVLCHVGNYVACFVCNLVHDTVTHKTCSICTCLFCDTQNRPWYICDTQNMYLMYMPVLCVLVLCHVSYVACFVTHKTGLGSCEPRCTKQTYVALFCVSWFCVMTHKTGNYVAFFVCLGSVNHVHQNSCLFCEPGHTWCLGSVST